MEASSAKLVVAPWGNPRGWKTVKYKLKDYTVTTKDCATTTSSSSVAISRCIGAKLLVLAPSTLAAEKGGVDRGLAKEHVEEFLKKNNIEAEVEVIPAVGRIRKKEKELRTKDWWLFRILWRRIRRKKKDTTKGSVLFSFESAKVPGFELFMAHVYLTLLRRLRDVSDVNEIHFDMTHGINYTTVATREALELAAATASALYGKKIKIFVYNSDPVIIQENDPSLEVAIHRVETIEYTPKLAFNTIMARYVSGCETGSFRCDELTYKLAKAAYAGVYLAVASHHKEARQKLEVVEKALNSLKEHAEGNEVRYEYNAGRAEAYAHAVLSILTSRDFAPDEDHPYPALTLEKIRNLAEKYATDTIKTLIEHDINKIKEMIEECDLKSELMGYKLLKEIYNKWQKCPKRKKQQKQREKSNEDQPKERNIYAHIGINYNTTFVKSKEKDIYFSYRDNREKVLQALSPDQNQATP